MIQESFFRKYYLSFFVFIGLTLLHFSPVQNTYGAYLSILISLVSCFNSAAFFVFAVGSQMAPDPKGISLTLAQLGVVCWVVTLPVNGWPALVQKGFKIPAVLVIFLCWGILMTVFNGTWIKFIPVLTGAFFFIIAIVYANDGRYTLNEFLIIICLSSFISIVGYWFLRLGLPVELIQYEGDSVRNVERIGSGKGDANMVGIMLPIGILGYLFSSATSLAGKNTGYMRQIPTGGMVRMFVIVVLIFVIGMPPLISTASRSALITSAIGFLSMLVFLFISANKENIPVFKSKIRMVFMLVIIMLTITITYITTNFDFNRYLIAMERINDKESRMSSSGSMVGGRSSIWLSHLKIIAEYPLSGSPKNATWLFSSYGRGKFGDFVAHNTYIEMGSLAGLPESIMFIMFCFYPFIKRYKIFLHPDFLAYTLVGILIFVSFMSFSAQSWKVFWIFMALVWLIYFRTEKLVQTQGRLL